jgi:hypothetical protein
MRRSRHPWSLVGLLGVVLGAMIPVAAQAAVEENISLPFDGFTVFVPCANGGAGEDVVFTGNLHSLITFTINGNNVSGKYHSQPQGLSGVGTITGDKYQGTGVTEGTFKASFQNGQYQQTDVNNFRLIGQGKGNNYLVHSIFHFTINAKGEVTAFVDQVSVECK